MGVEEKTKSHFSWPTWPSMPTAKSVQEPQTVIHSLHNSKRVFTHYSKMLQCENIVPGPPNVKECSQL